MFHLTELDPWEHQEKAFEWSKERGNSVICLPTGTGKTLVGCLWSCHLLNNNEVRRILLVEPSRFLVEQTHAYYTKHTNIPARKLYGTTPPEQRKHQWEKGVAVVTTPQTAVNDLHYLNFDAAVMDECHHTTGQHAFAELVRNYTFHRKLGLSATVPRNKEGGNHIADRRSTTLGFR